MWRPMCMSHSAVTPRRTFRLTIVIALAMVIGGCGHEASVTSPSVSESRCQPSLSATAQSFGPDGGATTVAVSVARECSWAAAVDVPWMAVTSGGQGQGDGTIAVRIASNPTTVPRAGSVAVADQRVGMTQQAAPPPPPPAPNPTPTPSPTPTPAPTPAPTPTPTPTPPPLPNPPAEDDVEVSGVISGMAGGCPNLIFNVGSMTVTTDGNTKFKKTNCRDLREGQRVNVKGNRLLTGVVLAKEVEKK
jgi:hypothetical protein